MSGLLDHAPLECGLPGVRDLFERIDVDGVRTPALVFHGTLRQSRKGGGPSPPQKGE
jgi:hypothetical protein